MAPKYEKKVSNYMPDDLFSPILSKLPLKSLKRFTYVCKSWSLLCENPNFMNMFRKNLISAHCSFYDDTCVLLKDMVLASDNSSIHSRLHLLYGDRFENKVELERPIRFEDEHIHLSNCVDGIFALFYLNDQNGILWNPATQECIEIPLSPPQFLPITYMFFDLQGFGYDHVRDDYKVIRCVRIYQEIDVKVEVGADWPYKPLGPHPIFEIFSLRSNSWKELDENYLDPLYSPFAHSTVNLNGVCHWLGGTVDEPCVVRWVVSFNLSSELFVTTPLILDRHASWKRELVSLNGSIAIISVYLKTASFHISILGELGIKESWVKLFSFEPLPFIKSPIGAGKKGEIFFETKDGEVACFDLNTQKFENIGLKGVGIYQVAIYKKNLLPIGGTNK